MSSKRILAAATTGWLLIALAYSFITFRHNAGRHDQLEAALGAFLVLLAPLMVVFLLLGLWRMVRMRFPHYENPSFN